MVMIPPAMRVAGRMNFKAMERSDSLAATRHLCRKIELIGLRPRAARDYTRDGGNPGNHRNTQINTDDTRRKQPRKQCFTAETPRTPRKDERSIERSWNYGRTSASFLE
jgi:hypothetical protein